MNTHTHVDMSEIAIEHFEMCQQLHPDVLGLDADQIGELIDAIPDTHEELITALKELKKRRI